MEKLMSVDTLADYLDVTPETVRRLARNKTLPSFKVGGQIRFRLEEVLKKLQGSATVEDQPAQPAN